MNIRINMFSIFAILFFVTSFLGLIAINSELQEKLYYAILNDSVEEVHQSLKLGADINFLKDNKPPLLLALLLKRSNAAKYLVKCGAKVNEQYIEHAVKACESELAVLIADKCRANLNVVYSGQTLMQLAIVYNDIKTVIWLINNGANFRDEALLRFGGLGPNPWILLELYKVLINHGYPVNDLWNSPIWGPCWFSYSNDQYYTGEIVQLLIKNGANPNHIFYLDDSKKTFSTPLMVAIQSQNVHAVKALLNSNANVNLRAYFVNCGLGKLYSPLSLAIEMKGGSKDPKLEAIVKLLIEHKANI